MSSEELVEKIHQFLNHQIETNGELSDAAKESLTVAVECIEQAYSLQRKSASSDLLNIFRSHQNQNDQQQSQQNQSQQQSSNTQATPNPAQFIQNLASTILSQATAGVSNNAPQPTVDPQTSSQRVAPKVRKIATEAEKLAAESFKNAGNDHMKQDSFQRAYDCYTQAINIDDNNAIYYSNRAAALSKLGKHEESLDDCKEAIEIDPTYSKAYGRMALAYASLDNHRKARDAYLKAVELDPTNESYRNNLRIAEEKLGESANAGANNNPAANMIRSIMSNPEVMNMAMRSLQDPRVLNLFGNLGGGGGSSGGGNVGGQASDASQQSRPEEGNINRTSNNSQQQQAQQQQHPQGTPGNEGTNQQQGSGTNPADMFNLGSAGINIVGATQQLLSSIDSNNPELVNNLGRMMRGAFMPPSNDSNSNTNENNPDRDPPPGYS